MRILIIPSAVVTFTHGSGETELIQLQLGFKLLGYQCDVIGPESDDFSEYDLYLFFSLREDVLKSIRLVNHNKYAILFPQVENLTSSQIEKIKILSDTVRQFYVHARNNQESINYSSLIGESNVIFAPGWFIKPFVHEPYNIEELHKTDKENCSALAFLGFGRDHELLKFLHKCNEMKIQFVATTDYVNEQLVKYEAHSGISFIKKTKYGAYEWYDLLSKCDIFYEPNNRVTCSLLEALWLKKTVISPYHTEINQMLDIDLVNDIESCDIAIKNINGCDNNILMRFHVDEVCILILKSILSENIN